MVELSYCRLTSSQPFSSYVHTASSEMCSPPSLVTEGMIGIVNFVKLVRASSRCVWMVFFRQLAKPNQLDLSL